MLFTVTLLTAGYRAWKGREKLAAATFLAGGTLAMAPCTLALLARTGWWSVPPPDVDQPFDPFTNQQLMLSAFTALVVSVVGLWRFKMTGFAWTTAWLGTASYLSALLPFNWLAQKPEMMALWCLPLAALEPVALGLERAGRVRWTLPFHLVALVALVGSLDVIAFCGTTLEKLGFTEDPASFFDHERLVTFSVLMNGWLFLILMLSTEKSASLDLRRGSRMLEILAILHILSPLFIDAELHHQKLYVRVDVWLYLAAALLFMVLAPFRSRWRSLAGGLLGCGLGSFLLVSLKLVPRVPFVIGLGLAGLLLAVGTYIYVRQGQKLRRPAAPASKGE
jgi:hypothetical protein